MKARFLVLLACLQPLAPLAATPEASKEIDRVLEAHWQQQGVTPHPAASDEVFLRRIYLDAVGRIPSAEEAEAFLTTSHPDKRVHLIDELLDSPGYANHMFNWWADLLRLQSRIGNNQITGRAYADYIREAMVEDLPFDQFTRELLTSAGFSWENGAIGFYLRDAGMPLDHLATTVQVFMGTQVVCAQCHDHPFDSWTQMDYYHMAAFTYGIVNRPDAVLVDQREIARAARDAGIGRDQSRNLLRGMNEIYRPLRGTAVAESGRTLRLPADYQYDDARPRSSVEPQVPFGPEIDPADYASRAEAFADWMTSPENPRFTLTIANRLWKRAFGLGLIEPVDDLSDRSRAAVPELMSLLEDIMRELGYSQKEFLRVVFNTSAYQREAALEEIPAGEIYHFTGPVLRRMTAEQTWDSIVTLMHGDPDRHTERVTRHQPSVDEISADLQRLVAGITSRSPLEIVELARQSSRIQRDASGDTRQLTQQLRKAREEGDNATARRLGRELTQVRNRMRNEVVALAADGGVARADETMTGDAPEMMMQGADDSGTMMMEQSQRRRSGSRGDGFDQLLAREIAADLGLDLAEDRSQLSSWLRGPGRQYLRASHVSQPAPRSHFLRLFGQSDREVVENASLDGSIGQALNLLNGPVFGDLRQPLSAFQRSIRQADGDLDRQMELVYLNLLARRPTADEMQLLRSIAAERGDLLVDDVSFALINGQEFLFVQ